MDMNTLNAFLLTAKALRIPCEIVQDKSQWGCFTLQGATNCINTYGIGTTRDEAIEDYLDALKDIALSIYQDNIPSDTPSPEFLLKILASTKDELKSCLVGQTCEILHPHS